MSFTLMRTVVPVDAGVGNVDAIPAPAPPAGFAPYRPWTPRHAWDRGDGALAGALGGAALLLYSRTLAPGLTSQSVDSNELITKSAEGTLAHQPGAPVYTWLAHGFTWLPFGEVATRVNWMSALAAALAVGVLYLLLVRHGTGTRLPALAGAVLFGLAPTFWSQAVIAELYTPNLAILSLALLALLEWAAARSAAPARRGRAWLVLAVALFGLSLGIHPSNGLYLPACGLFALLGWPVRRTGATAPARAAGRRFDLPGGVLAGAVGLVTVVVPYAWVYAALPQVPPGQGLPAAAPGWPLFSQATLGAFSDLRFAYSAAELPDRFALFLHLLDLNLGPLGLALAALGTVVLVARRGRLAALLLPLALANILFFVDYKVPDIDVFFIPAFWVAFCLLALGLHAVAALVSAGLGRVPALGRAAPWLPGTVIAALLLRAAAGAWGLSYPLNDQSQAYNFRDFYGNVFAMLPPAAYVYGRGSVFGYDLLYYTQLYTVRPDLHVQAGPRPGDAPDPPWPPGPVFAGTTKDDHFLPNFIADRQADNNRWYDPWIFGMFPGTGGVIPNWLKFYTVRPDPPAAWVVPRTAPAAHPSRALNLAVTPSLTLLGIDADPQVVRGHTWHLVRYWRSTKRDLPVLATVLGDHLALEIHEPLVGQLRPYLLARGLTEDNLPDSVIRDDVRLVIPSTVPPGRYSVAVSIIDDRITSMIADPIPFVELVPQPQVMTTIDVLDGPPLDPLAFRAAPARQGALPVAPGGKN